MYRRMKMLLGGLILSTGLLVATPVSYAAETQVNGEEDIELAYVNIGALSVTLNISNGKAVKDLQLMLACIYKNILMVVGGKLKDGQEVHQQQIMN